MYEEKLLKFIEKSVSPFHAIDTIKKMLSLDGYIELHENEKFILKKNSKIYIVRNNTSIIALNIGDLTNYSYNIVASHSDFPTFKVKPNMEISQKNYKQLNVEPYGGVLDATWFDRPLSVAGRIITKGEGGLEETLVNVNKNLLTIPSVAIHLNRDANLGMKYNDQIDMLPLYGSNDSSFLDIVATSANKNKDDILGYDLFLYNRNRGYIFGINDEFLSAPQLDDLACAYTSLEAFLGAKSEGINVYVCFDNEEVGSRTRQGAQSNFLIRILERVNKALGYNEEDLLIALDNSFFISADNAQGVHPNHPEKYDPTNRTYLNSGIAIKFNANQSYTTDSISSAFFKNICQMKNIPFQVFTNRNDIRGGGTLGNIATTTVSISSVDIGLPQLAMHSCMETIGVSDLMYMIDALKIFYSNSIKKEKNILKTIKKCK